MSARNKVKGCRFRVDGKWCRRTRLHPIHQEHDRDCGVLPKLHHDYVAPLTINKVRQPVSSDPFVRTSMEFRRSDLTYLTMKYGTAVTPLREWIANDRGITGARRAKHVPPPDTRKRGDGGRMLPTLPRIAPTVLAETCLSCGAIIDAGSVCECLKGDVRFTGDPTEPIVELPVSGGELPVTNLPFVYLPGPIPEGTVTTYPPAPDDDDEELVEL